MLFFILLKTLTQILFQFYFFIFWLKFETFSLIVLFLFPKDKQLDLFIPPLYFLVSSLIHWLFSSIFSLLIFVFFQFSSCSWFLVSCYYGQKRYLIWFQSWIYWGLFCGLICDLSWRTFHVYLKKNVCTLQLLDELFYKCLWSQSGLMWHVRPLFPY